MNHNFFSVVIDFDDRITPTEIRVQVAEADRHLHRGHCRNKPCRIYEQHSKTPFRSVCPAVVDAARAPGGSIALPPMRKLLVLIVVGKPMLLLDLLSLNLFLAQWIVIAWPIEVDDVINVLEDRFS